MDSAAITKQLTRLMPLIPEHLMCEIIVVQNGDDSQKSLGLGASGRANLSNLTETFSSNNVTITFRASQLKNVNSARNLGVKYAQSDIILFLDDDVIPENKNLFLHVAKLKKDSGIEGGLYLFNLKQNLIDVAYTLIANQWILSGEIYSANFHLVGGLMWGHRDHFTFDGGFDEAIAFGGSETEFLLRVAKSGLIPIQLFPAIRAFHLCHLSIHGLRKKAMKQALTHKKFFREFNFPLISLEDSSAFQKIGLIHRILLKLHIFIYRYEFKKAVSQS